MSKEKMTDAKSQNWLRYESKEDFLIGARFWLSKMWSTGGWHDGFATAYNLICAYDYDFGDFDKLLIKIDIAAGYRFLQESAPCLLEEYGKKVNMYVQHLYFQLGNEVHNKAVDAKNENLP